MASTLFIELKERCESQMSLEVCNGCTQCFLRCSAGVPATREEWESLKSHITSMDTEARENLDRVLAQSKEVDLGEGVSVELCRFLDMETKACSVYEARPLICRLLGHVEWLPCPIELVPREVVTSDALALMQEYAKSERKTLEEWNLEG